MPKCGNCTEQHATVNDVIACYQNSGKQLSFPEDRPKPARSQVPSHIKGGGTSTVRQREFVAALLEQTGKTEADLPQPLDNLSFEEASASITQLKEERSKLPKSSIAPTNLPPDVTYNGEMVPQGTYTVVFDEEKDDRITVRFRAPKTGKWTGTQLVEYMYGPSNEDDFRRCGNWTGRGYRLWVQHKGDGRIANAIKALAGDEEARKASGYLYSLESSNCYRCGRKLTVPTSIHRGLGPECASILAGV